jgi:glycosyltransferase involved in cell wall biosynthesis
MRNIKMRVAIVLPVFNDWDSFGLLLKDLGEQEFAGRYRICVVAVDDGSSAVPPATNFNDRLGKVEELKIIRLAANLGHQRAIAVGMVSTFKNSEFDAVVIMDCDGEDRPSDVAKLLAHWDRHPTLIIVARRARRSESLFFRCFYILYKVLFRALTGEAINFGNFCLIPKNALQSLVHNPAIWNNLAAAIKRSRLACAYIPIDRGERISGVSQLNFVGLALHGISAISVYSDVVFIRIVAMAMVMGLIVLVGLSSVVYIRLATEWAIPGWASYMTGALAIIFSQTLLMAGLALLQLVGLRSLNPFVPVADAMKFVAEETSETSKRSIR